MSKRCVECVNGHCSEDRKRGVEERVRAFSSEYWCQMDETDSTGMLITDKLSVSWVSSS